MPRASYSSEAEDDLGRITDYIALDNLPAAITWLEATRATCELIAIQPGIGQRVKTRRFGNARRHVIGSYLIYYRPIQDGVEILMVVHGARDQERLL